MSSKKKIVNDCINLYGYYKKSNQYSDNYITNVVYVHFVFLLEDCVCWLYKKSGAGEEINTTDMAVTLGIVDAATRPTYVRMRKYALDITRDVEMTMSNPGDLLGIIDTARVADILS